MKTTRPLSKPLLAVMTVGAGAGIANLYYNQPLLEQMTADMHAGQAAIGLVPTLTQIGYSLGMLLLVPLGDMLQRRRLVLLFTFLAACMSVGTALSASSAMLLIFSFLLGIHQHGASVAYPVRGAARHAGRERAGWSASC